MSRLTYLTALLLAAAGAPQTSCDNVTTTDDTLTTLATLSDDTCGLLPWEAALEDWATADRSLNTRHGRIMALPPTQGYYVSDRIDLVPPPPPRQQLLHRGPYPTHSSNTHHGSSPSSSSGPSYNYPQNPQNPPSSSYSNPPNPQSSNPSYNTLPNSPSPSGPSYNQHPGPSYQPPGPPNSSSPSGPSYNQHPGPSYQPPGPPNQQASSYNPGPSSPRPQPPSMQYDEWQATPPPPPGAGKIVNRPPNPYKDQFKPSYAPPSPSIPVQSVADRVDTAPPPPPHKQVSETDLHLLRAIEKLVYRVDLMEKRLRKMEENMLIVVAGTKPDTKKPDPCPSNFTRLGAGCYHISKEAANWKGASFACRKLKANLLEMGYDEKRQFVRGIQADKRFKGADFWTGGLNPGLLWIWSHSAKPVANSTSPEADQASAVQGEGRCLALVHTQADYVYKGQDCSLRHRYVCEREDDTEKLGNEIERVARKLRARKGRTPRLGESEGEADE